MSESNSGASPKSPRYFYTDPLAAAWMAKHFGMQFCSSTDLIPAPYAVPEEMMRHIGEPDAHRAVCLDCNMGYAKFFIRPESLQLLEWHPENLSDKGLWEALHNDPFKGPENRIIQRNGIPFMWPESEAA